MSEVAAGCLGVAGAAVVCTGVFLWPGAAAAVIFAVAIGTAGYGTGVLVYRLLS